MERHGHLDVEQIVRDKVLAVSAATIDRLLKPVRIKASDDDRNVRRKSRNKYRLKLFQTGMSLRRAIWKSILSRTAAAHCRVLSYTAWSLPMCVRDGPKQYHCSPVNNHCCCWNPGIGQQFPINILGVNSDNDSAFINDTLLDFCEQADITFTRSRPYRKNDQAWIEQKNGSVIRRFAGYERFSGPVAGQALAKLHALVRLYVNYFQPSFKLIEKSREGATVTKRYDLPATPCDRLLMHPSVHLDIREEIQIRRASLDRLICYIVSEQHRQLLLHLFLEKRT